MLPNCVFFPLGQASGPLDHLRCSCKAAFVKLPQSSPPLPPSLLCFLVPVHMMDPLPFCHVTSVSLWVQKSSLASGMLAQFPWGYALGTNQSCLGYLEGWQNWLLKCFLMWKILSRARRWWLVFSYLALVLDFQKNFHTILYCGQLQFKTVDHNTLICVNISIVRALLIMNSEF